jgi:DNA-binding LacI/PurR family transcriptional regulator
MVTIREVAKQAKVSPSTVSLVLNDTEHAVRISESTRDRVIRVAHALGYQPNSFARALRKNKSSAIALLAFDIVDPYCVHVLRGAEEVINANGFFPILSDIQNNEQEMRRHIALFKQRRVEGLLILASSVNLDRNQILELRRSDVPLVVIGRELEEVGVPTVVMDNVGGAFLAVEHLLQLGHEKVGFILGPANYIDSMQRWEGATKAMRAYATEVDSDLVAREMEDGWGPEAGYHSMKELMKKGKGMTAVFAFDDISAFGAIRAITEAGLVVPDDISVVGFDDLPAAAFYNPPLTTIHNSMVEMGRKGAELLLELIANNASLAKTPTVRAETSLVVRKTTAPRRSREDA